MSFLPSQMTDEELLRSVDYSNPEIKALAERFERSVDSHPSPLNLVKGLAIKVATQLGNTNRSAGDSVAAVMGLSEITEARLTIRNDPNLRRNASKLEICCG